MKNITVSRDKVEQWLEDLEFSDSDKNVIADIKKALAAQPAPVQEPVGEVQEYKERQFDDDGCVIGSYSKKTVTSGVYKLPHGTKLYTTPPAAQTEPVQEPVGRTDQQIVDQTEELAVWLLSWGFNRKPETCEPMRESEHPMAKRCWSAACHIQEMLTSTDPENSVAELDVDATPPAQPAPVCWKHGDEQKSGCAWCDKQPPSAQPAPVQSCYCPNCEAMGKELAAIKAHLTEEKKVELATNWFAEDWAITKAVGMLHDYDRRLRKTTPPAAPVPEVCCGEVLTCLKPCTPRGEFLASQKVPDAITDNSESPEYRTGWNDCRQAMMEMMK
jgi:hypothetical protein